ncbi:hypothetical protein CcaverHIS641_0404590 [Cutaneotrichosporon cavernicola]|nr:hypothetical protein CcaverHIS641_0404590 [Cutaneotrichosporon cavernicola]
MDETSVNRRKNGRDERVKLHRSNDGAAHRHEGMRYQKGIYIETLYYKNAYVRRFFRAWAPTFPKAWMGVLSGVSTSKGR